MKKKPCRVCGANRDSEMAEINAAVCNRCGWAGLARVRTYHTVSTFVPPEIKQAIADAAAAEGISVSRWTRRALVERLP